MLAVVAAASSLAACGDRALTAASPELPARRFRASCEETAEMSPLADRCAAGRARHGVETDASGRVQGLDLRWNGLVGEILAELGAFRLAGVPTSA